MLSVVLVWFWYSQRRSCFTDSGEDDPAVNMPRSCNRQLAALHLDMSKPTGNVCIPNETNTDNQAASDAGSVSQQHTRH